MRVGASLGIKLEKTPREKDGQRDDEAGQRRRKLIPRGRNGLNMLGTCLPAARSNRTTKVCQKPARHQTERKVQQNRRKVTVSWNSYRRVMGTLLWVANQQICFLKKL